MQLTDSTSLQNTIEDIARNVEIKDNLSIAHPDYQTLELPPEIVAKISKLPQELQDKYLSTQLRSFLYGIYYNGSMKALLAHNSDRDIQPLDIENSTVFGMDLEFYNRLHDANTGEGHFDPGWLIIQEEDEDTLMVAKGELKLYLNRDRHLQPESKSAAVGDIVAIRFPKNFVQNGFYMSVGNAGKGHAGNVVRIYFNLTPEGAIAIMGKLTARLNASEIPFSFKTLYNPQEYRRYDSGVLYFNREYYGQIEQILQDIYQQDSSYFNPEIPLFTKHLAPGLGLAEEPDINFSQPESFGTNRCQIVANGLLSARDRGNNSLETKIDSIYQQFSLLGLDRDRPYLNANSEDIYTGI